MQEKRCDLESSQKRSYALIEDNSLSNDDDSIIPLNRGTPHKWQRWCSGFIRVLCLTMFLGGAFMLWKSRLQNISERDCTKELSVWSPIMDDIQYGVHDFEANVPPLHDEYSGTPTAELEERWRLLEAAPAVLIPPSRITSLYRNASQPFVRSTTPGKVGFIATIEVFHHLHCLNILRQTIWHDKYPPGLRPHLFQYNSAEVAREHAEHCIATLRQALMCDADLTPYLWHTGVEGRPAKEDFQAAHKCKVWRSVVDSVHKHAVDIPLEALQGKSSSI